MAIIKIGTKISYRGGFGTEKPQVVSVTGIERVKSGEKYGKKVGMTFFRDKDECVFDLDNGHWCYGDQIDKVVSE